MNEYWKEEARLIAIMTTIQSWYHTLALERGRTFEMLFLFLASTY
jgi:hypothetical protein